MTASRRAGDSTMAPLLRAASQWIVGIVLAVVLLLFFVSVTAVQMSSAGTGQRILRSSIAVSTDIDAILPALEAELRQTAQEAEGDTVQVPDFPIAVELERQEALSLRGSGLRARILEEAAARVYEDGMSAWAAADPDGEQDVETISIAGAYKRGLGFITDGNHNLMLMAAVTLGILAAALGALLLASLRSWARPIVLGAVTLGTALPLLATAVGVRFGFRTAQEEADPFVDGMLDVGVEAMWVPIWNYLALSVLGAATLLLALAFMWFSARRSARSMDSSAA